MKIEDKNTQTELVLPPKRKKALALNLAHEVAHIQKHGDAYLPIFLDNMRSFTMETDTHGRIFDFQHIVRRFPDGTVRLYFDHRHGPVSYTHLNSTQHIGRHLCNVFFVNTQTQTS